MFAVYQPLLPRQKGGKINNCVSKVGKNRHFTQTEEETVRKGLGGANCQPRDNKTHIAKFN